jgi:hypothetical protein
MIMTLALALAQASSPAPRADAGDDVVVIARHRKCALGTADHLISDRGFREKAREWASGRPVRVHVPAGSPVRCEAEMMFRLNRYGVIRATFIEE